MGGPPPDTRRRPGADRTRSAEGSDPCDLSFTVDLIGFKPDAAVGLTVGDTLHVEMRKKGEFLAAACVRPSSGEVVGSLAGFLGLAELLRCLKVGTRYVARIDKISAYRCTVIVERR